MVEELRIFKCPVCNSVLAKQDKKFVCAGCSQGYDINPDKNIYYLVNPKKYPLIEKINKDWSGHWEKNSSPFSFITKPMRMCMTGPLLKKALKSYVRGESKIFLEAGSGLSETSVLVDFQKHTYISLDISDVALLKNINNQIKLQGDLFNIPILDQKIDLIFNVGVHEHYSDNDNSKIFNEFHKVLKENGKIVLLWPRYYGPLMLLAKIINKVMSFVLQKKFELYPNQNYEIKNFNQAHALLQKSGFRHIKHYMSFFDIYSTMVLIYKKDFKGQKTAGVSRNDIN